MQCVYREICGIGEELYKERRRQIVQRIEDQNFKEGAQNNQGEQELERDPNTMDINKGKEGDRTYYVYRKQSHMAKNCWQRKRRERRVVEMLQESAKDNREQ